MRQLKRALGYDQPMGPVMYTQLFAENEDGDQGKFAETLRDQNTYQMLRAYPDLERAVREQLMSEQEAKGGVRQLGGDERAEIQQFVANVPLFKQLDPNQLDEMLSSGCEVLQYEAEENVVVEGAHGHHMFIVVKGTAYVQKEGVDNLDFTYRRGDFFGELVRPSLPCPRRRRRRAATG
eukprot:SAG11_NODE_2233_length_3655_cov_2.314961_3_plen_179_part_00